MRCEDCGKVFKYSHRCPILNGDSRSVGKGSLGSGRNLVSSSDGNSANTPAQNTIRYCSQCRKETKQIIIGNEFKCTVCGFYQGFKAQNTIEEISEWDKIGSLTDRPELFGNHVSLAGRKSGGCSGNRNGKLTNRLDSHRKGGSVWLPAVPAGERVVKVSPSKSSSSHPLSPLARLKELLVKESKTTAYDVSQIVCTTENKFERSMRLVELSALKYSLSWFRGRLNGLINSFDKKKSNYSGADVRKEIRKLLCELEEVRE